MTHLLPSDTHRQMPQRALSTRYCCRCLKDRPTKDGRNAGLMFTCAACLETLAKAEVPK